jgi:hypothetical protein
LKIRWIALGAGAVVLSALLVWAASKPQANTAVSPFPGFMPRGALLYVEAKDFASLLEGWNASPEKQQWLKSDDYEVFSRSRICLRFGDAQHEFAAAAGVPPDMNLLSQTAGKESAVALYDIGKLEFLYITRLPSPAVTQSALWQARPKFESRSAGGFTFFVHTDAASGRTVAFAVTGDYLLLATREDLIASSLQLIAGGADPKLSGEDWYTQAVASAGRPGDLRMVLNMDKIAATPYFRSYWIQPNLKEMRGYSAAVSDLHLNGGTYQEDRVLLPKPADSVGAAPADSASAQSTRPAGSQAVADLLRLVPPGAGVYRASADPTADASLALLQTEILSPNTPAAVATKIAPAVNLTGGEVGTSADLETRIDQAPTTRPSLVDAWSDLRNVLSAAQVHGMLSFDSTRSRPEDSLIDIHSAVVLQAANDWDSSAVSAAFSHAVEQAATTEHLGAAWRPAGALPNSYFELDGLLPVRLAVRGRLLIVTNNAEDVSAVLAGLQSRSQAAPAIFAAGFRLAGEEPDLIHLSTALDQANPPTSPDSSNPDAEPPFFSANLASLGRVLSGVDSESVVIRSSPGKILESVTYRWK